MPNTPITDSVQPRISDRSMNDDPMIDDSLALVTRRTVLAPGLATIRFLHPSVARSTKAGQFVNVLPRAAENDPMLRRPFSVYRIDGDEAEIIVQVHGRGTALIANTRAGDYLDVLGPLGNPWNIDTNDYETGVLVIGGVGVASMPLLTATLRQRGVPVQTFYGARTKNLLATAGLADDGSSVELHLATDDGSLGHHGTNLSLLRTHLDSGLLTRPKLFVCGPTGMMIAAQQLAGEYGIPCELSLETEMACGIGICQGCPVVTDDSTYAETGKRFRLVCMDGPSFDSTKIRLTA